MVEQLLVPKANSSVKNKLPSIAVFFRIPLVQRRKLVLPCNSLIVSEYLFYLHETERLHAALLSAFCALKWVHDFIPYGAQANLVDNALIDNLVQASKRVFSRHVSKKEPITPDMI